MKQVALTDFETYMETSLDTLSNVTTVGALNAGSITSGFGAIDNGSSAITTTGTMTFGSLSDGSITATAFVDEDNMASNSATLIPTQQSVKAYVDTVAGQANNVTGLNATGVEINTVADPDTSIGTTAVAGGDGIVTQDTSGNVMRQTTVDTFDTYLAQTTKTLTNKTLTSPVVTGMHLNDSGFTVEGSAADGNETTVAFTNPTADRTITFPNATGTVAMAGDVLPLSGGTMTGNLALGDNVKAIFGAGSDLEIYHDASNSYIKENGTGVLKIQAADLELLHADGSRGIRVTNDGGPVLYNDGSSKLTVNSGGVAISGNITVTGTVDGRDIAINIPSSLGSAGQVLTVNSGGSAAEWAAAGGDPDLFKDNASSETTPVASGANAVSIGSDSQATAQDSLALGTSTRVLGQGSVAIGVLDATYGVLSGADHSLAIGRQARVRANCDYSIAIGYSSDVNNGQSAAIGYNASAFGGASLGIGHNAYAGNDGSLALGYSALASNPYSSAIGQNSSQGGSYTGANGAMALGGSRATGTDSLAAAISTNSSSYGATGNYSIAMGKNSKASDIYAVGIGYNVLASGSVSVALGDRAQATGSGSVCIAAGGTGWGASATGASSVTIGDGAIARGRGKFSFASGNTAVGSSMMQSGQLTISLVTTNNTAAGLNSWNYGAAGSDNQLLLPNNSAFAFHGTIVARQKASEGTACAAWRIEGLIRREGSAGTTVLVNSATTVLDNTPNWGMSLSADTTNGALKVQATGAASTNIRWTGTLYSSEVTYA